MSEEKRIFNINGNYIEKQEITVENGGILNFGNTAEPEETPDDDDMKAELLSVFMGNEEETEKFIMAIKTFEKDIQITAHVKALCRQRVISEKSKGRVLWNILTKYGYYTRSESNWNSQI